MRISQNFASRADNFFSISSVRMQSITDSCADRSILALLSAYQECLVTSKFLITSQMIQWLLLQMSTKVDFRTFFHLSAEIICRWVYATDDFKRVLQRHGVSDQGREKKVYFHEFSLLFFVFLLMNLKSFTFTLYSSILLKDFHRRLRAETIQMFDFIWCFRQKLRVSVHVFVQNQ